MATVVTWNGSSFTVPGTGEENWGGAANVDGLLISLAQNGLQKSGGSFTLSGDIDFGPSAGLKSIYYKSRGTVSSAGVIRLAKTESIAWRNNADSGNNLLTTDTSDNLTYNGIAIASSSGVVPVASGGTNITSYTAGDLLYASGTTTLSKLAIGTSNKVLTSNGSVPGWSLLVNANIDAAAAIAYSKLSLTGSIVNADVSASAAIARSKIDTGSGNYVVINANDGHFSEEINLSVVRGGTGVGTLTANNVILGNGTSAVQFVAPGTSGNVLTSNGTTWQSSTPSSSPDASSFYTNGSIAGSVAANALTIALKDKSGSNASGSSVVSIGFRNATAATGTYTYRTVSTALSVVIPASTTIGTTSAVAATLYVYAMDNAGTVVLAVSLKLFDEGTVQSSSAISGGSSATALYSTSAQTSLPIRLIGRISVTEATAGTWATTPSEVSNIPFSVRAGNLTYPTVQSFLSGSGTYTTPANVLFLKIKISAGGGGGGGAGSSAGTGATGGNSTFGSQLSANGGVGGAWEGTTGGAGGTATLGSGPIGLAVSGGIGQGGLVGAGVGGSGGSNALGGAGGGSGNTAGSAGAANTGGGGGGAGGTGTGQGAGGGAGGYIEAIIIGPLSATYSYAVGAGGAGGAAGVINAGGPGGLGVVIVEEHYQ